MLWLLLRTESSTGSRWWPVCRSHSLETGLQHILQGHDCASCMWPRVADRHISAKDLLSPAIRVCSPGHDLGSSLKPMGRELHQAVFSYLDVLLEALASSPVCSNSQLGPIGGLQERVQRYLWASCILYLVPLWLFLKLVPLPSTLYVESSNAFLLKFCLWNLCDPNSSRWCGSTRTTPWLPFL